MERYSYLDLNIVPVEPEALAALSLEKSKEGKMGCYL